MAFEALNFATDEIIQVKDFTYEIIGEKKSDRTGEIVKDAGDDIVMVSRLSEESRQKYDTIKPYIVCPECKKKGSIVAPRMVRDSLTGNIGSKKPAFFRFSKHHESNCVLASEASECTLSSHSPLAKPPQSNFAIRSRDYLIFNFFRMWEATTGKSFDYKDAISSWEKVNREETKKEVLIRNKNVLLPFLSFYTIRLEQNPEPVLEAAYLLSLMPQAPRLNQKHPLFLPHSFLRGLSRKFPYLGKSSIAKNLKMQQELLNFRDTPENFFLKRKGSFYDPRMITAFKDLERVNFEQARVTRLIKAFLEAWEDDDSIEEEATALISIESDIEDAECEENFDPKKFTLRRVFQGAIPDDPDKEYYIRACFELVMICEYLEVDCCETLEMFFDGLLSKKIILDVPKNVPRYRTATLSKINMEIKTDLFYDHCNDPNLFLPTDK